MQSLVFFVEMHVCAAATRPHSRKSVSIAFFFFFVVPSLLFIFFNPLGFFSFFACPVLPSSQESSTDTLLAVP